MKDANVWFIVSLVFAGAGVVLGLVARAWGVVCIGVGAAIVAAVLLF